MTLYYATVDVDFEDAAERTATRSYILQQQYDTTANAGAGNMGAVLTAAGDLVTALNVLTMSAIPSYAVKLSVAGGGSANIAANNQVVAFTRAIDQDGAKTAFEVPAWDDVVFDENSENLLSDAYNTAAEAVAELIRNPETFGLLDAVVEYSQSRTHKSRNVIND